jgi:type IV secretory pathway component VirB8
MNQFNFTKKCRKQKKISRSKRSLKVLYFILTSFTFSSCLAYMLIIWLITLSVNECFFISIRDPAQGYPSAMDYTGAISGPFCVLYSIIS